MACCQRLGVAGEKREVDFVLLAFDAMQQHGQVMGVVPRLGRAAELASRQGRKDKECVARAHLATISWFQAQHEEGRALAERAVALAREIGAPPAVFYAQLTLANLRYGCGDIAGAADLLQSNIDFLTGDLERAHLGAIGIPSVMSRSFLAWYLMDQGRLGEAGRNIERAAAIADGDGRPYSRVLAHLARGRLSYERGDYAAAAGILARVRDWCWQHRIFAMEPIVTGLLASALCRTGAGEEGLAATRASIGKQYFRGAARMASYYLFAGHGEALFACGDAQQGGKVIAEAVAATQSPPDPCLRAQGHLLHGRLLLAAGEAERARAELERALEIALRTGMVPCAARAHDGLARCGRGGDDRQARRHAEAAAALYRQCDAVAPLPAPG
jgi:tetratricopeptide (TPR) repeat protein